MILGINASCDVYPRASGGYAATPRATPWLCHYQPLDQETAVETEGRTNTDVAYGDQDPDIQQGSKVDVYIWNGSVRGVLIGKRHVQSVNPHIRPGELNYHHVKAYLRNAE